MIMPSTLGGKIEFDSVTDESMPGSLNSQASVRFLRGLTHAGCEYLRHPHPLSPISNDCDADKNGNGGCNQPWRRDFRTFVGAGVCH